MIVKYINIKITFTALALLTLVLSTNQLVGKLTITEFMANNDNVYADEDGQFSDWIEIHNAGEETLDLNGYHLSDNIENIDLWTFPEIKLEPGKFVVIFASGKDKTDNEIHTNFRLDAKGEFLALIDTDGKSIIQSIEFPKQRSDISYGYTFAGNSISSEKMNFLTEPTPGSSNASGFILPQVGDTKFSVDRGFFSEAFQLEIQTITAGAQIYYTLDGKTPATGIPPYGILYDGPITISSTTVLRAIAVKSGMEPSNVDTQTYFFLDDIIHQYADSSPPAGWPDEPVLGSVPTEEKHQPQVYDFGMDPDITETVSDETLKDSLLSIDTFSIVMNLNDLTNNDTGIYTNGQQKGREWERPASLEFIRNDGTKGFQVDCGLRIRGGSSRKGENPKHSFRLFFREKYGQSKLRYELFGTEGTDEFDSFDLRTAQNYSWSKPDSSNPANNTFLRDVFTRDLQRDMKHPYTRSRYCHLYINGIYWGLFMTQERSEADFAASYFGGKSEDYDVIKVARDKQFHDDGILPAEERHTVEATDGNLDAWKAFHDLANAHKTNPTNELYFRMQGLNPDGTRNYDYPVYLDVNNLIDYMLIVFWSGNIDAPLSIFKAKTNNWFAVRNRVSENQGFQFFQHDSEHTMGIQGPKGNDRTGPLDQEVQHIFRYRNPQFFHQDLMGNEEYQLRFADRVQKHLFNQGALTPEQSLVRVNQRIAEVEGAILAESARWGDFQRAIPYTVADWENAVSELLEFFLTRNDVIIDQLKEDMLFPDVAVPKFSGVHGGFISADTQIEIIDSANVFTGKPGTIYYTLDNSDPRSIGGEIHGTEYTEMFKLSSPVTTIKARKRTDSGLWSALLVDEFLLETNPADATNLAITEVHYHPVDDKDYEFIEFHNISGNTIDLNRVLLTGDVVFHFPSKMLAAGEYVVIVRNEASFVSRYSDNTSPYYFDGIEIAGAYEGGLSNRQGLLRLQARDGTEISSFTYEDRGAWPVSADGLGRSIEIIDTAMDPADPISWRSSSEYNGSPGRAGVGPSISFNEWLAVTFPEGGRNANWEADPDHDGIPNVIEYVMGTDPIVYASRQSPITTIVEEGGKSYLSISFPWRKETNFEYSIEVSSDMNTWKSEAGTSVQIGAAHDNGDNTETLTVRDTVEANTQQRFIRLTVVEK